jgi:cobalt transporter subunit CbtB
MQDSSTHVEPQPASVPAVRGRALAAPLAAAILGVVIIWAVGFSHVEAIHNAAHDTRHSNAFPCH